MSASYSSHISFDKIAAAAGRLRKRLHRTPVMTSSTLDSMAGRKLYFKCEHLQKTGSFKARGALNAVSILMEEAEAGDRPAPKGVATHSSGNHGQALAWAANQAGLPCCVVVPEGTSAAKTAAIRAYGAELVTCAPNMRARRDACAALAAERGYATVPPFDDYRVMAGQGTVAMELLEQVPELDAILVPISGGGLSSGVALACSHLRPHPQQLSVFCVEPQGKGLAACLAARQRLWPNPDGFLDTIADGLRLQSAGELTFPVLCDLVQPTVLTVTNEEMSAACKLAFRYLKQVIEPASAAAVHAGLKASEELLPRRRFERVGVVLTGGNVNPDALPWPLAKD